MMIKHKCSSFLKKSKKGTVKVFYTHSVNYISCEYKMTQYHSVKNMLSDYQPGKLKFTAKSPASVTLRLSSDMIGTDETNFPHNSLLIINKSRIFSRL